MNVTESIAVTVVVDVLAGAGADYDQQRISDAVAMLANRAGRTLQCPPPEGLVKRAAQVLVDRWRTTQAARCTR